MADRMTCIQHGLWLVDLEDGTRVTFQVHSFPNDDRRSSDSTYWVDGRLHDPALVARAHEVFQRIWAMGPVQFNSAGQASTSERQGFGRMKLDILVGMLQYGFTASARLPVAIMLSNEDYDALAAELEQRGFREEFVPGVMNPDGKVRVRGQRARIQLNTDYGPVRIERESTGGGAGWLDEP